MLLPLLISKDGDNEQKNLMVMMMAMQSQAPNTQMGSDMILPMLLMNDDSNNENLMMYMMMSMGKPECKTAVVFEEPIFVPALVINPAPVETVFRTWRVNEDGTKTLISEEE